MKREQAIDQIENTKSWDFLVIGGGATGLGVAVDAAARGYSTLLVEQDDFAKGTSSRSTKLVHGGVRYLKQGNISLVLEALRERGLLCENAPHLVHHLSFIVPIYSWWEGPFYGIGMKIYDRLAGKLGLNPSRILSREETLRRIPTLEPRSLQRGVEYYDGQFDDSRLAVNLAQTIFDLGGAAVNYMPVAALIKENGLIAGGVVRDLESGKEHNVRAKVVVNATGSSPIPSGKWMSLERKTLSRPVRDLTSFCRKRFCRARARSWFPILRTGGSCLQCPGMITWWLALPTWRSIQSSVSPLPWMKRSASSSPTQRNTFPRLPRVRTS